MISHVGHSHYDNRKLSFFITARMQYGDSIKALTVTLNTAGMVGINRIHNTLSAVFGVPISTGTIFNMVKSCARNLGHTVEQIRRRVTLLSRAHFNETGIRVDKKMIWLHNASNRDYTYLSVEEKRGRAGMDASGVLPYFQGIVVGLPCINARYLLRPSFM